MKILLCNDDGVHARGLHELHGALGPYGELHVCAPDAERSAARKAELAKTMKDDYRLVAYIDCGPDKRDGAKGKPSLAVIGGRTFVLSAALGSDVYAATGAAPLQMVATVL